MKKLVCILLLGLQFAADAQMTAVVIGPFPGYGRTSNTINATNQLRIPLLYYVPPELIPYMPGGAKYGQTPPFRCAMLIDRHGCGEKSTTFNSYAAITTAETSKLYNNGMPQYLRYSTSDYAGKKFAAPGTTDSFAFIYVFPQSYGGVTSNACAGNTGLGLFLPAYTYDILQWAEPFFGPILDTTREYLSGLSFGGGGVWLDLQDKRINRKIAAVYIAAGGYIDERNVQGGSTAPGIGSNWSALDDWPGGIICIHSTDDHSTQPNGASLTDWAIDSIIRRKSRCSFNYIRRTTGDHSGSWTCWQDDNYINTPVTESNGQTYTFSRPFQAVLLQWNSSGRLL